MKVYGYDDAHCKYDMYDDGTEKLVKTTTGTNSTLVAEKLLFDVSGAPKPGIIASKNGFYQIVGETTAKLMNQLDMASAVSGDTAKVGGYRVYVNTIVYNIPGTDYIQIPIVNSPSTMQYVCVTNGDYIANNIFPIATAILHTGYIIIKFDRAVTGAVRLNFIIFHE